RRLDDGVHAAAYLLGGVATRSARLDRVLDVVVHRIASGVRTLGRLARRPQTGQLHHYYLEAVLVLAALLALLLLPLT
ncbi:MAG: NADH-quinone oxidoreductase subunit L, partial [Ornithinibacter sp.]